MSGSDTTRVISIAGDPARWEALSRALREAGFTVTTVAPEDSMDRNPGASAGRSLAAVCHDLRTPLSVMIGWVHLLQSGKLDEAGTKRAIEKLHDSLEEQVRILDGMLETPEAARDAAPPAGPKIP